jgi:ribose transport system permease protein
VKKMSADTGVQEVQEKKGSFDLKEFLRRYNIALVFIVLVVFSVLSTKGLFFTSKNLLNVGERASIVGVAAIGQMLIMITGGIDLSTGGVMAMSFTCFAILTGNGMPIFLAVLCAILIGAAAGAVSGILL